MAYATQTKTSRRKSLSHKQFGSFQTHPARPSMEKALQNLVRWGPAHKSADRNRQPGRPSSYGTELRQLENYLNLAV